MNENEFSAAFDAEDAFASRMDYMRRRRRRRRRRSRKGRRGESAKAESFRTSTNLLCPRWDPENNTELEVSSGSRFGKILFEVRSVCAERERVSQEESRKPGNPQSRQGYQSRSEESTREWDGLEFREQEIFRDFFSRGMKELSQSGEWKNGHAARERERVSREDPRKPAKPQSRQGCQSRSEESRREWDGLGFREYEQTNVLMPYV